MSNYKVEFTLKQHTPIIHFQSDQIGATLRASELKPKFDRFLKENVFKKTFEEYKTFLIGFDKAKNQTMKDFENKEAFDYKVNILCTGNTIEPIERQSLRRDKVTNQFLPATKKGKPVMSAIPTFFANMGDDWEKNPKQIVWSENDNIQIEIISFKTALIEKIIKYFEEFIFTVNFGMRQSKGFGSYEVISSSSPKFEKSKIFINFNNVKYKFTIDLNNPIFNSISSPNVVNPSNTFKKYGKLFEIISLFSKTYRSGINQQGYYFKSLMYKYATEFLQVTWDKKYLKSSFLGNSHQEILEQRKKYNNLDILNYANMPQEYMLRDLLGLSTSQEWLKYGMTIEHKKGKDGKILNDIKRYKSPITFKIIKKNDDVFDIYLIVEEIKILNKSFQISCNKSATSIKDIKIKTPEQFDIYHYLKFCFSSNIDAVVNDKNKPFHKIIKNIFNQLNIGVAH
ncbi:hypothetical protein [Aliarcobacter butzleri]|uniref:hypothetical protein n=1 Tax=Aliarcobacter butzleri TaxID=28197 RepID=UPI003B21AA7B